MTIEEAVKMHTKETARAVKLEDRGTLEVGMRADINIIDFDNLRVLAPQVIYDLPAGGEASFQKAIGYKYAIVGGSGVQDGVETDARPGALVRGAQPAPSSICGLIYSFCSELI